MSRLGSRVKALERRPRRHKPRHDLLEWQEALSRAVASDPEAAEAYASVRARHPEDREGGLDTVREMLATPQSCRLLARFGEAIRYTDYAQEFGLHADDVRESCGAVKRAIATEHGRRAIAGLRNAVLRPENEASDELSRRSQAPAKTPSTNIDGANKAGGQAPPKVKVGKEELEREPEPAELYYDQFAPGPLDGLRRNGWKL